MKIFLYFYGILYLSVLSVSGWDDVVIIPDIVEYYVVPAFSQNSSSQDFFEVYDYVSSFLQIPQDFGIYSKGEMFEYTTSWSINDTVTLEEELYRNSITANVSKYLRGCYLFVINRKNSYKEAEERIVRINFIILTDLSIVEVFYDRISVYLQETLFFIFSSAKENHQENIYPAHQSEQYFYTNGDISKDSISKLIVNETLTYRLLPARNKYNVFIVGDETLLEYAINITEQLYVQSEMSDYISTLYVAALKRNESFSYQSIAVHPFNKHFSSTKLTTKYYSVSNHFSTDLVETYFKKVYKVFKSDFIQWNVLITDSFPLWLKNTELIFDSFNNHFDVYIITTNNTHDNLLHNLSVNINEIILNDENSTQRNNHIILQNADIKINFENFPTMKKRMLATTFDYHSTKTGNNWWIWLIVGCFLIVFLIGVIILWYCRCRKSSKIEDVHRPFSPSILSQKPEEASEKQNMLYIDETRLHIHLDKILGKGTSSFVYEGYFNGVSPVAELYPKIETRNFSNCIVAVKIATIIKKYEFEQVFREVDAALKIGYHRHICCLLGWTIYQKIPTLVFEYVNGTNLHSWIQTSELKSEKTVAKILWQITEAMEHISASGIVHKDLAARNILLNEIFEVKVTDFGLSSMLDEKHIYEASCQRRLPLRWMALEALKQRLFSEASDVWSFGVLMWEIFNNGNVPYGEMDGHDIVEFLSAGNRLPVVEKDDLFSTLMLNCWKEDREERPTFTKIKKQIEAVLDKEYVKYGYIKCVGDN